MIVETSTDAIRSEAGHLLADYVLDLSSSEVTAYNSSRLSPFGCARGLRPMPAGIFIGVGG